MGFSFKIAPGVRIRPTKRGIRTSFGPRVARLHIGGGTRAGVSTGAGPVTFYTSLSGSRRHATSGSTSRPHTSASSQRALAQAATLQQAKELQEAFNSILNLHRQSFPEATPPTAPPPPEINANAIIAEFRRKALTGMSVFQRVARKQAQSTAEAAARQHIAQLEAERQRQWHADQSQLNEWWRALLRNEPDVVLAVLTEAFDDNEAPAAAVGVDGSEVSLVVLVPQIDVIPEKKPTITASGNITVQKATKAERNVFHTIVVNTNVLLTLREALAVAPGLTGARIIALQHSGNDVYGRPKIDVLLAARFERERLVGVQWESATSSAIVHEASSEVRLNYRNATKELLPLDLSKEPELTVLLSHMELDELLGHGKTPR